ncbi:THUMP-like domain-containing protein [Persicitalea jodogahamensis]|uniref:THUMP-like domain-containing protein n=1 Tax=Persicitalea jodogahamensis TaxID=402147 RepID=A0A8J3D1K8_9BACT|nr:hypothetical protein [Persicitalea jodogahamensis]GHB64457.1 hypothetical protein GCM10007390_17940 [Persicitalea jodogahamensis]
MNDSFCHLTFQEQAFIQEHIKDDVPTLLLQSNRYQDIDVRKAALQIAARQKAKHKLPDWYANEKLYFPPPLSVEQSSSEATARFKASLISGQKLIDITGGMGVDCHYLAQNFEKTVYFEQLSEVARATAYNFGKLGILNKVEIREEDAIAALAQNPEPADWIYADPARRDDRKRKVAQLADCTPDLTESLPTLFRSAPNVLVKTAPLLDIDLAVNQMNSVQEVYVTGFDSECKEVLYVLHQSSVPAGHIPLKVRILSDDGGVLHSFDFTRQEEAEAAPSYDAPQKYLYEPHAAILKAGAFKSLAVRLGQIKLASNTHLYTSRKLIADFPGRSFEVVAVCRPDARALAEFVPEGRANLTLRNFPGKVDDLRKKWRIKEGGDVYLFAATLFDGKKVVIVARKPYI